MGEARLGTMSGQGGGARGSTRLRLGCCDILSRLFDGNRERLGRVILEQDGEDDRPEGRCRAAARPVVDLSRRHPGEPGEGGLADVGAGQERSEVGL